MPSLRIFLDRLLEGAAAKVPRQDLTHVERLALVRRHGDFSLAYSTAVQQKLSYFGDADGYIAFGTKMKHHFALGDPVAHPPDRPDYIRRFVEAADSPWFVQIGEPTARVLSGLGYQVNRLGVDTRLELPAHDFSGKRNETVRYSERWLLKKGFSFAEGAVYLDEVQRLSQNWRADRIVKRWEMAFLNRPFADHLGIDMRRFVLYSPEGELVALLDFDPLFRDGKVIGYTTSVQAQAYRCLAACRDRPDQIRRRPLSRTKACRSSRSACRRCSMSEPAAFAEMSFWRNAFERAYKSPWINRSKFNLKGQAAFKRRFHGVEEPTYIAFRRGRLVEMLGLLRLIKAI